jgi:RimJ/RimL family protein N-acetyltransferase
MNVRQMPTMPGIEATFKHRASFAIAKYRPEDREHLIAVINAVCSEGRWMHTARFNPTPRWTHALSHPECPDHLLLVPSAQGYPIGWCRVFPTDVSKEANLGIGLLVSYRNQGLGTRLVHQAVTWAEHRGFSRLKLTTHLSNRRAIHIFEKCGFTSVEQCNGMWVFMIQALNDAKTRSLTS